MLSQSKTTQRIISHFRKQPCWMIEPLAAEMNYSIPSVRRFLSEVGYYSSFTHNGKWYTIRSIPKFKNDGLWFSKDIGFSNVGSLTKTIIKIVSHSKAGLTAETLGKKLRSQRCHSVLVHLVRRDKLQREKSGRSYVYFAEDTRTAIAQRKSLHLKNLPSIALPAEIAVLVLVEFIQNPKSSFDQLAKALSDQKSITIAPARIEKLFEEHGLKKTA